MEGEGNRMIGHARLQSAFIALLAMAAVLLPMAPSFATAKRLALVIGNNAYTDGMLKNPINDARTMAATLTDLGFEVHKLENADRGAMQRAVLEFGRKLNEETVGLFYFAGHGMQVRGANYLIPVKASIQSEDEVEVEGVDVAYVLARMATAKNQFNIVILDACRNNPFQRSFRSSNNGLAAISAPTGTLIAYATAPGSVASDGDAANGVYTAELAQAIRQPGVSMEEAFKRARGGVIARTQGKQTPWESSSVVGNFMFRDAPAGQQVASLNAPAGVVQKDDAAEIAFWNSVKDSRKPSDFQAYLDSYPSGSFEKLARARVRNLRDEEQTASLSRSAVETRRSDGDLGAALTANWPAVEAALRDHLKKEFETYRLVVPSTALPSDFRLKSATLEQLLDEKTAVITLEGQSLRVTSQVVTHPVWFPFRASFAYEMSVADGKVAIGKYRFLNRFSLN
jgi:hypothetical protein